jgi:hypothetical protein
MSTPFWAYEQELMLPAVKLQNDHTAPLQQLRNLRQRGGFIHDILPEVDMQTKNQGLTQQQLKGIEEHATDSRIRWDILVAQRDRDVLLQEVYRLRQQQVEAPPAVPRVVGLYPRHFEEEFLARQDSWLEGVEPEVLALSVTELRDMELLSTRAWNPLISANVRSVRDLARLPDSALLKLKNFGRISLKDVRFALARLGFTRPLSEGLWNGRIPDHHRNWAARPSSRKRMAKAKQRRWGAE